MPSCIEIGEYFDEVIEALVESGLYSSKAEVVRDALRKLLESIDMRVVGVRAYRRGATLWRALKIAGVGFDEFISFMIASGVAPEVGCRSVPPPPPASVYVLDPLGVEILGRLGVLEELGERILLPRELENVVRLVEIVSSSTIRARFESVTGVKSAARKLGVTVEEAASIVLAARHGLLVACDPRLAARSSIVPRVTCCYSLLRLVDESVWRPRFRLLPLPEPLLEG